MKTIRLFSLLQGPANFIPQAPVLAQPHDRRSGGVETHTRTVIRPSAILDVVHRRGRSWGLLASYEEKRLGL
ncbi:hypothetical protein ACDA63_00670 [Uliginosibacterium sp. sgz301328]|uniref:hypothetical protein n=1 Tax=Uliginosibacterium sp. sgz301328 TaxID=3243764 RepID=UPI00359D7047